MVDDDTSLFMEQGKIWSDIAGIHWQYRTCLSDRSKKIQPDSNLLLALRKMTSCYFQAIMGVFLHSSGAVHYGEALHCIAAACAGCCTFTFVQLPFCWCSHQTALAYGRHAGAPHNHKCLHLSCEICNCTYLPRGPIDGLCTAGPAPVVHSYPRI